MYRTDRYFGKNDGQHNFFGEEDIMINKDGTVMKSKSNKKQPPQAKKDKKSKESG